MGNLEARKIPFVIVANKIDLPEASADRITSVFPQHTVVPISALHGENTGIFIRRWWRNLINIWGLKNG